MDPISQKKENLGRDRTQLTQDQLERYGPIQSSDTVEKAITYLYNTDRFYSFFIQHMRRKYDETLPAVAGVSNYRGLELVINPRIWERLDLKQQAIVLEHECKHILLDHLNRVKDMPEYKSLHSFYNICMDLAVNSTIKDCHQTLPWACNVEKFQEAYPTLKKDQTFDYYVGFFSLEKDKLIKQVSDIQQALDDHESWEETDEPGVIRQAAMKEAVKRALEDTKRSNSEPSDFVRDLTKGLFRQINNWRQLLRQFPQEASTFESEGSRMRRNRRYGVTVPGQRKTYRTKIAVGVDTSGSIGPELLGAFTEEINKIIEGGAEVCVYFFDTAVVQKVDCGSKFSLSAYDGSGGGGTLFQPVLDEVTADRLDGLIMLTDGFNFDAIFKPSYPVLWAIVGNKNHKVEFGKVIHLEIAT